MRPQKSHKNPKNKSSKRSNKRSHGRSNTKTVERSADSMDSEPNITVTDAPADPPPLPAYGSQFVNRWYKTAVSLNTSTTADITLSSFGSTNPLLVANRCYLETLRVYLLPGKNTSDATDYRGLLAVLQANRVSTNTGTITAEDVAPPSRAPSLEFHIPRVTQELIGDTTQVLATVTTPQGFPTSTAGSNPVVYCQAKFRISI
jgi:hypothetical protein